MICYQIKTEVVWRSGHRSVTLRRCRRHWPGSTGWRHCWPVARSQTSTLLPRRWSATVTQHDHCCRQTMTSACARRRQRGLNCTTCLQGNERQDSWKWKPINLNWRKIRNSLVCTKNCRLHDTLTAPSARLTGSIQFFYNMTEQQKKKPADTFCHNFSN